MPCFFHWQLSRDSRCVFRVWAAGLSVIMFVRPRRFECLQKEFAKNNAQTGTWSSENHFERRLANVKKVEAASKLAHQHLHMVTSCHFQKDTGFKASALNANSHFQKIQGSKRALWMPNSHFRKDIGFKAGALNAQLPCKESESTLSQGIRTWKDCDRGESDSSTRAVRQRVWNGSETALKLNVRSPSTARWVKKLESSLEGGAESSLAALRKNVSNGIEMILWHRQETPNSAADRKSMRKLQASAATETVAD